MKVRFFLSKDRFHFFRILAVIISITQLYFVHFPRRTEAERFQAIVDSFIVLKHGNSFEFDTVKSNLFGSPTCGLFETTRFSRAEITDYLGTRTFSANCSKLEGLFSKPFDVEVVGRVIINVYEAGHYIFTTEDF